MTKQVDRFYKEVRALGVFAARNSISGESILENNVYIDFRDATKAQEKKIAKLAKTCGLEILVGDKGAIFQ
jgi:SET domain-containing protein